MQSKNFWKPLLEIYLFGSKENINYQIQYTLNSPKIYAIHINHFFNPKMKYVIRGKTLPRKSPSVNCPDTLRWNALAKIVKG